MQEDYRSPIPKKFQWRTWAADPEGITGEALLAFVNDELFPALKELSGTAKDGRRRVVRDVFEDAYNYMKSGQLMRQVINKINGIDFNNLAERQHFGDIYEQILNDLQSAGNAGEYYTPRAVTAFMADRIDPHPGEILLRPGLRHRRLSHLRHPPHARALREEASRRTEDAAGPARLREKAAPAHALRHQHAAARHRRSLLRPPRQHAGPTLHQLRPSRPVDIVLTNPPFGGREEDGIESNFPKHFQTRETADLFLALIVRLLKPGGRAAVVLPDGSLFGEGVKTRLKEHLMEECNLHTIVRLPNSVFKPYACIGTNLLVLREGRADQGNLVLRAPRPRWAKGLLDDQADPRRASEALRRLVGRAKRKGRKETEVAWKVTADEVKARGYNLDFKNPHTVADDHGDPEELLAKLDEAEKETASLRDQLKAILEKALLR